jgi:hypothetical protein
MKKILAQMTFILTIASGIFTSVNSYAWIPSGETVTVTEVIQWQDNSPIVFRLSSGHFCYIENGEKNAYSVILALYMSGNKASIHCHDAEENKGGYMARKMHRVVAFK